MSDDPKTSFKALVRQRYLDRGMTSESAIATVHLKTGIGTKTLWHALRGYRVQAETAKLLREWAFAEFGVEDLDFEALVLAPTKKRGERS